MLVGIIAAITGVIGVGGIAVAVMGSMGVGGPIIAGIVAFFVAKNVPWKMIATCAAAALIAFAVFSGYEIFKTNQKNLEQARVELAQEKLEHAAEKARADNYIVQHDAQVIRIEQLEKDRSAIDEQTAVLQAQISDMTLEEDFNHDTAKAIVTLNARNAELNRLLNNVSRGSAGNSAAITGDRAGKTKPASSLQRALHRLRKTSVPKAG